MLKPIIKSTQPVVPMIYAYTTPEIKRHDGWTKIGYTEQDVMERIKQQTHTADIKFNVEWKGNAIYDDGTGERFTDKDFHSYLIKSGVEQEPNTNNEWFHITGPASKVKFDDFRSNHGILTEDEETIVPYILREEQQKAVELTLAYAKTHDNGEFLWNAKPRFGKTLSVYDFCKRMRAEKVLIVTNRPAIASSWYSDYENYIGRESGYFFVSNVDGIKGEKLVIPYDEYKRDKESRIKNGIEPLGVIDFVSLQDLKGSVYFGGGFEKLKEIKSTNWDVLVIDEAHEGVDTYKTDVAFDQIKRKFTLHLSGTPFKALANNKFPEEAIFNYTYADEQRKKRDWDNSSETENPYESLPKLNLYTYQMSEIIKDEIKQGIEINGETEEYAFDLNEFFKTNNGKFVYESSVDKFLDALTLLEKYPFSTEELRNELKHTFWLLDRVESAKALAKKLKEHPVFCQYEIILAAGDGKIDDDDSNEKSYQKVVSAIKENDKTITLSVGQLTTGVTVPEWTAVLMLSNVKSPALYMQAAFRAQNPCMFREGLDYKRKENAYVFDFDPARTLIIFEEFANDLALDTSAGKGDSEKRKENIRELLNFFPVIGEDEDGELIELDAEHVLSIPRKIKSQEVVRRGFMSNFLFQNIGNIFSAPKAIMDIIDTFEPVNEAQAKRAIRLNDETKKKLSLNDEGEVELSTEEILAKEGEIFGERVYDDTVIGDLAVEIKEDRVDRTLANRLSEVLKDTYVKDVIKDITKHYGDEIKKSDTKKLESDLNTTVDRLTKKTVANFEIQKKELEIKRTEEMQNRHESGRTTQEIEYEFAKKRETLKDVFIDRLKDVANEFLETSKKESVTKVETIKKTRVKESIEDGIRNHLRGFSRTIPSFLMAYGDDTVTLATFEENIPDLVFKEVTSISIEQFRLLRDGGPYVDPETGETKHYEGHLFDSVVFDDSVKEFIALKQKLADYFDEKSIEDIFDYIPPQKTNQIFTPKDVVKKMVDLLEEENPGCFDSPEHTFLDPYMKSGLYITEIVKRLYQSEKMKKCYPDGKERLRHIFEKQVYGLAPTEIIYNIAINYILGFNDDVEIKKHNFVQLDALEYAKNQNLKEKLDEIFGE